MQLTPRAAGGSSRGWSYFTQWKECQLRWFLKYHYALPLPEGEPVVRGIEPRFTARPLLVGSLFHTGAEHYYRSGWKDDQDTGTYSVDAAMTAAELEATRRLTEWERPTDKVDDLGVVGSLLTRYHQMYGPGGTDQDYPAFRVADWNHGPAAELELGIDLEDGLGSIFTSRLDAVLEDQHGVIWGLEHKTSAASRVHALLQKGYLDGQITGQYTNLIAHFPNRVIGGVALNVVIKDAGKGRPSFKRQFYQRNQDQVMGFLHDIRREAQNILAGLSVYSDRVSEGVDPWEAAISSFDGSPPADRCYGFGKCDFYDLCLDRQLAPKLIAGGTYVPKIPHGAAAVVEA